MTAAEPAIVLMPVYDDADAAGRLIAELRAVLGDDTLIVAVDDGSVRQPLTADVMTAAGVPGVILRLKRNVGHQRAIATGLQFVADTCPHHPCIIMDCDGEDRPSSIPELLRGLAAADIDIVVAKRKRRAETLTFKVFYVLYKLIFRLLTGHAISFGNFMALKPDAVRRLAIMPESGTHLASAVLVSKLRIGIHPLDRGPRYAGQSRMNFASLVLHGFRALMIFAEDVLVRVGTACIVIALLALAGIIASILLKSSGLATPGWFSVALGILFLVLLQTSALALMSLLLTGLARGTTVTASGYGDLIDQVIDTRVAQ